MDDKYHKQIWRGKPMRRRGLAPCAYGKCPKGDPDRPKTLWPRNAIAYQHYRECKATLSFPDDPIVRRNAAVIMSAEQICERRISLQVASAQASQITSSMAAARVPTGFVRQPTGPGIRLTRQ